MDRLKEGRQTIARLSTKSAETKQQPASHIQRQIRPIKTATQLFER